MRLVAITGTYAAVEHWFYLAGLRPDAFLTAEHDGTRYVGHHSGRFDPSPYDDVIDVALPDNWQPPTPRIVSVDLRDFLLGDQ